MDRLKTGLTPSGAESYTPEELNALVAEYGWCAPVRILRELHTGRPDPLLEVMAPWRAQSSLRQRPVDGGVFAAVPSEELIDRFLQETDLRIVAEEGTQVRRGDVIIEMSNNSLSMQILQSEADLAEKQNILRNTLISMEQERLSLRQEKLQLDLDVQRKKRTYEQNEELWRSDLLAREEYLQAREDYELAVGKRALILERQRQDSLYRTSQVGQMEESLRSMQLNMQLIRQRVDNLKVKAPIDGEVGMLEAVLGQSMAQGANIGQINDLSAYKVTAQIDEHYIDRVTTGLTASFERQDTRFEMVLRKVYPEVRNGQFKADFVFRSAVPENIRSGQTYYLNLQLGQPTEAVIVPRGSFYQTTGGRWIYVLDASGEKACRREIRIGRQNPQYYEVLEGLRAGERVITSSYDNLGDHDVLILKR